LLAGLVALVTVGLTVAAVVTYEEQRSFLYSRIDSQVRGAIIPIERSLGRRNDAFARALKGLPPALRARLAGQRPFGPQPPAPGAAGSRTRRGPAAAFLPPGTFGELLGPGQHVVGQPVLFDYGQSRAIVPRLPRSFPVSKLEGRERLFTFTSKGVRYRAVAVAVTKGTVVFGVPLREADQTLNRLVVVELLVGLGVIVALLALGWLVIAVGLRPLERIRTVATDIAHGDLSRRVSPADPRTEVGRLGVSLNEMLSQIEQAFADRADSESRLRQFLADASHELRTPLAAVRGYAELYRLGAGRDPAELERSMARIEAEAVRMGGLVEDLLLLARLDELPVTELRAVDLTELAAHAASDVRATAPGHELRFLAQGPVWALADPDGVRQVLGNLLRNAAIHTPGGTLIELRVFASAGRAVIEVRDHGPGLPEGAGDHVFDRFWRSEGGRARGPGGAGLGLAIVKAIVTAHNGEVHAANAADEDGAVFTVTLVGAAADTAAADGGAGLRKPSAIS
jgi:two-component system OmpR family sensor kinase